MCLLFLQPHSYCYCRAGTDTGTVSYAVSYTVSDTVTAAATDAVTAVVCGQLTATVVDCDCGCYGTGVVLCYMAGWDLTFKLEV